MFIGICILAVLCLVTIFESFRVWKGNNGALECKYSLWFNGVLGLAATAYSGFLLTQAVGIPLWTTASLPILWPSGLACAIGLVEILASTNRLSYEGLSCLSLTANLVHIGEGLCSLLSCCLRCTVGLAKVCLETRCSGLQSLAVVR